MSEHKVSKEYSDHMNACSQCLEAYADGRNTSEIMSVCCDTGHALLVKYEKQQRRAAKGGTR